MPAPGQKQPMRERLWRFISPEPNSGCWLWTGGFDNRGHPFKPYGRMWVDGRTLPAHRVAWTVFCGEIPDGMVVCHKCDTPPCVNPDHLFLGSYRDNTQDMIRKGRDLSTRMSRRGTRSNWNKLTPDQVTAIRNDERLQRQIAKDYGITQTAVSRIKRKVAWSYL